MRTVLIGLLLTGCGNPSSGEDTDSSDTNDSTDTNFPAGELVAFPGAEGFGAYTTGGRGGDVCIVENLNADGPGSLADCLGQTGARTVVFHVSGSIPGPITIVGGDLTIAGQTSPNGIVVEGGLVCDNVYEANDCNNVVIRHLRSRTGGDGMRLGGAQNVILDHVSLGNATDENLEISRSMNITVQYSVIAEPVGDHYHWGGLLMNYSTQTLPLDNISIHHTMWNGVYGRLPEMTCEENGDAEGTNCSGHTLHIELTNNLLFDVYDPIWYNRCTTNNDGNYCEPSENDFFLAMNWVNNVAHKRSTADTPMLEPAVTDGLNNDLYFTGNEAYFGDSASTYAPDMDSRAERHGFPEVTVIETSDLADFLSDNVGAFPRDAMDARLVGYLSESVDDRTPAWANEQGIDQGDAVTIADEVHAVQDQDSDGMPDAWESAHNLDPEAADGATTSLGDAGGDGIEGCTEGYTNLECYLNELAASLQP